MTDEKIELTEKELTDKINEAVRKAVEEKEAELTKSHNDTMAQFRQKAKQDQENAVKKAVEDATLSTEDRAKKQAKEELETLKAQNAELLAYKQNGLIKDALSKEKLPLFLVNDSRLQNAKTDEELASAIKVVKEDYTSNLPSGATISTNINGSNGGKGKSQEELEAERLRKLGTKY